MEDAKAERKLPFEVESSVGGGLSPAKKQHVVVDLEYISLLHLISSQSRQRRRSLRSPTASKATTPSILGREQKCEIIDLTDD